MSRPGTTNGLQVGLCLAFSDQAAERALNGKPCVPTSGFHTDGRCLSPAIMRYLMGRKAPEGGFLLLPYAG
jgi:hypothetical protein